MPSPAVLYPQKISNRFWHALGALALPLNALRHRLQGYTRPRDIDPSAIAQAIGYDWDVVARWRKALRDRDGNDLDLRGKSILELGPGPDLGVGLILLAYGAASYTAVDRHPLAATTSQKFYDELIATIVARLPGSDATTLQKKVGELRYICREDFSFSDIPKGSIDLIVSNAAFEHFDDIADVIKRATPLVKPGALFVADIDLQTHSRIIRNRDPLNIYRYSDRWYRMWKFVGSPNRIRPHQFQQALHNNGWKNIVMSPLIVLDPQTTEGVRPFLAPLFCTPEAQIHYLDIVITAKI